eukprot:6717369-Prymnesium_polylepis.1
MSATPCELRGRGTRSRTWHACETRERRERGPTLRSSTKSAPARPAGPSCKGRGWGRAGAARPGASPGGAARFDAGPPGCHA